MKRTLKKLASELPMRWQQELKRRYFGRQIRNHTFRTDEPEFDLLSSMVRAGAWALDIGANVGHYTVRLSELVGERGRVISFEPVPETFELLAANVALIPQKNVTLINAAASDSTGLSSMQIPKFEDSGLDNFYTAHLSERPSALNVLRITVDCLTPPEPIRLVKIDAEGHELPALRGMKRLLDKDHPILIVEDNSSEISDYLIKFGYSSEKVDGSSNRIFRVAAQCVTPGLMRL